MSAPGAATSARPGFVLALAGTAALVAQIVACGTLDAGLRDTCLAVVPALEPGDGPLEVVAVEPLPGRADTVRVRYRATPDGDERLVHCAFGIEEDAPHTPRLIGVRDRSGDLAPARLYLLNRFWLADPAARAEGRARLRGAAVAR